MSNCNAELGIPVLKCLNYAEKTDECAEGYETSVAECSLEEDQGYEECDLEEDQGYSKCSSWGWFSWLCKGWTWVVHMVCVLSHWVSKWVCVAWHFVKKWVCIIWKYIVRALCIAIGWAANWFCKAFDQIKCILLSAVWLVTGSRRKSRIEKIFVLMLENRSYDHMLGFAGLHGRNAADGSATRANDYVQATGPKDLTATEFTNLRLDGTTKVHPTEGAPLALSEALGDPPHGFGSTRQQCCWSFADGAWTIPSTANGAYPPWSGGGFVATAESADEPSSEPDHVMRGYDEAQVPVLTALAREFAVCDNWYPSVPGPTWPNRFFVHAATSGGNHTSPGKLPTVTSSYIDGYRFEHGTVFNALNSACVDWRVFEGDEFPQVFALTGMNVEAWSNRFTDMHEFESAVSDPAFRPSYVFIEPAYGDFISGSYRCGTSQHGRDDVTRGEHLIKRVYEAIRSSPHWEKSALVITYDEHGGFFDHVPAPDCVAPGDLPSNYYDPGYGFKFDRLGVRVPAVVVSPLIPKGTIDHKVYDHSSVVRTIGKLFGFGPLTNRDASASDFLHLFSLARPRTDTRETLPEPAEGPIRCSGLNPFDNTESWLPITRDGVDDAVLDELVDRLEDTRMAADEPLSKDGDEDRSRGRRDEPRPVPSSFWGFNYVALRRGLSAATSRGQRRKLLRQYEAINTERDARRFSLHARLLVAADKGRAPIFETYDRREPEREPGEDPNASTE